MELLTIQETAKELRVAPITIRRYIDAGKLPAVRVGKGVRIRKEVVEQFVTAVEPKQPRRAASRPRGKPLTMDDPLWQVVGIGHSGQGDVSSNKHKYLADAYAPKRV